MPADSLSQVVRELAQRLITHRKVRYTGTDYTGTEYTDYFVYGFGQLIWQCQSESQADKIYGDAIAQAKAVIREAMQKALEAPSLREAINDIPHVSNCDMQYMDGELNPDTCWRCGLEYAIQSAASSLT